MNPTNKDYRLEPDNDGLRYAMELLSLSDGKLVHQKELDIFCTHIRIGMLVLFGSVATDGTHQDSDIDMSWFPIRGENPDPLSVERSLCRYFHTQHLDVVDMRNAPPLLLWNIARHGIPLHTEDETSWFNFQGFAIKQWDDLHRICNLWSSSVNRFLLENKDV